MLHIIVPILFANLFINSNFHYLPFCETYNLNVIADQNLHRKDLVLYLRVILIGKVYNPIYIFFKVLKFG